jgi:hypothetical protein
MAYAKENMLDLNQKPYKKNNNIIQSTAITSNNMNGVMGAYEELSPHSSKVDIMTTTNGFKRRF